MDRDEPAKWDSLGSNDLIYNGGSTHMALLRGNGDSTFVLHWHSAPRLNLLAPMSDSTVGWPVPGADKNLFCAGHSTLADGRLLVIGGTLRNTTGHTRANLFDPHHVPPSTNGWNVQDQMSFGRWYPTATTLSEGRVLATSGQWFANMVAFGGYRGATEAPLDSIYPLNLKEHEGWNVDPIEAAAGTRPPARQGHGVVYHDRYSRHILFGGRGATAADTIYDVWKLVRSHTDHGVRWRWDQIDVAKDPAAGRPIARSRSSFAILGDTAYVFAGLTRSSAGADSVLDDVWRLFLRESPPRWEKLSVTGGPGPRYGHTAVVPPGPFPAATPQAEMVVYGGRTTGGALADSVAWLLSLPRERASGTPPGPSWSQVATTTPIPGRREGHSAVLDQNRKSG